jgi:hypothetical protein
MQEHLVSAIRAGGRGDLPEVLRLAAAPAKDHDHAGHSSKGGEVSVEREMIEAIERALGNG